MADSAGRAPVDDGTGARQAPSPARSEIGRPGLWLTWEKQRRNRSMAARLGVPLIEIDAGVRGLRRYLISMGRTLQILRRRRPALIFAQNPSLVLALIATSYGRLTRTPVVVDAHNAGIFPFEGTRGWANALCTRVIRDAALTIVSNDGLAPAVIARGGRPFVLPDPLPDLPSVDDADRPALDDSAFNVLFICTWAEDEPYVQVLQAAARLSAGYRVFVTGNSRGRESAAGRVPENVTLTGFVSEAEFVRLLRGADLVLDLTTREHCLVCGAYEAVSTGKPMLLSDTVALRNYFGGAALYTDNTVDDIVRQIECARLRIRELERAVRAQESHLRADWERRRSALLEELDRLFSEQRAAC